MITGHLKVILDSSIHFQWDQTADFLTILISKNVASSLSDFGNRWCTRQNVESDALKDWKLNIFNVIDKIISCYSGNTKLLPPNPKSTFRHLKLVSRNFIGGMFWFKQTLSLFDSYIILIH